MCGIAGVIGKTNRGQDLIEDMTTIITHRGPDDAGYFVDKDVMFGMRRLAIIDLNGGHQPINNEDNTMTIVFNGEIYNYQELQHILKSKGHRFKTNSDTEVLIHLYEEYGAKMLPMLRGMFTFAIYDKINKEVFIARDYFGIKPLYYLVDQNRVVAFGSEIKSLLLHPAARKEINEEALFQYLSYQYNPLQETFFKRIWKLPPGHYIKVSMIQQKTLEKKYWAFEFSPKEGIERTENEKNLAQHVLQTMRESVRAHMIADVPVGAFLSGGIDSAVIVALLSKEIENRNRELSKGIKDGQNINTQKLSTFTVTFDATSEASEAAVIAKHFKTHHTEINVTRDLFLQAVPKMMWHMDEPLADPSAVGLYFLSNAARQQVKVVLSGEGADELFGGYNIYREPSALNIMKRIAPQWMLESIIKPLSESSINFFGKNYLRRFFIPLESRYIGNARIFSGKDVQKIWRGRNFVEEIGSFSATLPSYDSYYKAEKAHAPSDSAKMQYIDINHWLPGDILQKADKMTMAHSLELRVPFLDIEVANVASYIPESLKYKNGTTKYLLRLAMKNILPRESARRKKLGFPTALKTWLKNDSREAGKTGSDMLKSMRESISASPLIKKYYDMATIMGLIEEHGRGFADHSRKIYLFYTLAVWYEQYFK